MRAEHAIGLFLHGCLTRACRVMAVVGAVRFADLGWLQDLARAPAHWSTACGQAVWSWLYRDVEAADNVAGLREMPPACHQLQFLSDGQRKGKSMTFNVSCPNTCDLKTKPVEVRVVGERCVKRWEILT